MSVPKLQVRLVRLIRFTMLDSLGVCLHLWIYERSQSQIQLTESDRDPPMRTCAIKNSYWAHKLMFSVDLGRALRGGSFL